MKTASRVTGAISLVSMNLASIPSPINGYIALDISDNKLKFYNQSLNVWENYNDVVNNAITTLKGGVPTSGDTLNKLNNKINDIYAVLQSNDTSLDTMQEVVDYIKNLNTIKINYTDVVDNLTSSLTNRPLSANQGRVLKNYVDTSFYFKTDFINVYTSVAVSGDKPVKTNASTGKIDNTLIPIIYTFVNDGLAPVTVTPVRVFNSKSASVSTATVTFNITADNTAGGTALFADLENCGITATARSTNTANNQSPWVHIQSISNNKTITVRIKRSNSGSILIGGNYNGNADNDLAVTVYLTVTGQSA